MMLMKKIVPILSLLLLTGCIDFERYRRLDNATAGMDADGTSFIAKSTINNKPATLTLDTDTQSGFSLTRAAAQRLGLTPFSAPKSFGRPDGKLQFQMAGTYPVTAFDITGRMFFAIYHKSWTRNISWSG
jgi:hypothetical protein